ncbi:hypothetical protein DP62_6063 [Burkholderia pseudomallei]|nr:hypothetical protein DP62_6063 [Burkholderia pseudomallei]
MNIVSKPIPRAQINDASHLNQAKKSKNIKYHEGIMPQLKYNAITCQKITIPSGYIMTGKVDTRYIPVISRDSNSQIGTDRNRHRIRNRAIRFSYSIKVANFNSLTPAH